MDVLTAITSRRSIRAFRPDPVPEETLRNILQVASRAPSATNIQPWRVNVVMGEARERLCGAVLAARQRGEEDKDYGPRLGRLGDPFQARRRQVGIGLYGLLGIAKGDRQRAWEQYGRNYVLFDAPVGLFFTMEEFLTPASYLDMGLFMQSIMVAARGHGLHTCTQACWLDYHRTVRTQLNIPEGEELICGMALGHADEAAPENRLITEREPVDAFARFHR